MAGSRSKTASDFAPLLSKCGSEDADIRYMVLADMCAILAESPPNLFVSDNNYAPTVVEKVVELVDDANGDVQSQALKTVGPLGSRVGPELLKEFLARLLSHSTSKSLDRSIYITAARTVVTSLARPTAAGIASKEVQGQYEAVKTIVIPRLIGQPTKSVGKIIGFSGAGLLELDENGSVSTEGIELANQVVICYGVMLQDPEKKAIQTRLLALLDDARPSIIAQKKAVAAIASLSMFLTENSFSKELIPSIRNRLERKNVSQRQRRMLTALVGSLATTATRRLEASVHDLVPFVLEPLNEAAFDELTAAAQDSGADVQQEEVVEAALTTLDELFSFCGNAMATHASQAIDASLRFLSYDPNLIEQDDDDEDMVDDEDFAADEDDDFEDEAALSDSDDSSWKIRRCAAKVSHAIIKTGATSSLLDSGLLYDKIMPVLIRRFNEREDSVRLENIAAVALLVRKTADATTLSFQPNAAAGAQSTASRKRRRSSTVAPVGPHSFANDGAISPRAIPSPTSGPQGDLANITPRIAIAATNVYKQKSVPSKQAASSLLRDLILARQGRLDDQLSQILPTTIELAKTSNTALGGASSAASSGAATGTTLRISCLQLLSATCDNHSSKALASFVSDITSAAITSAQDNHFKIAAEAILTLVSLIQVLTPPRSLGASDKSQEDLARIFDVLLAIAKNQSVELEVRLNSIRALGILLARTAASPKLLSSARKQQALSALNERLKNELTQLAAINAVDSIANASISTADYPVEWLQATTLELANQLRKANRNLSSSSLNTLNNLLSQDKVPELLGDKTNATLMQQLLPLLDPSGAGQLTTSLLCLSQLIGSANPGAVDPSVLSTIAELSRHTLAGTPFDAYLDCVETIGRSGAGPQLLPLLMSIGVGGPPEVVGAAIGTLLAVSSIPLEVTYQHIAKELQASSDDKRKALALSVLGQYGSCLGASSPLSPRDFLPYLDGRAEVSRAAALALGRAGAANTAVFFPAILNELSQSKDIKRQSALLPAVKEILIKASPRRSDVSSQADELWAILMQVSATEDNRTVGAECVGKLVTINPEKYVPEIRSQASSPSKDVRALIIQALRFALADSDSGLDEHIKPIIAPLLTAMLRDDDIENRRLALMTLNAAFSSKPSVIAPQLSQLISIVVERSRLDPKLVREVQMGPFKHKVDDGLDIRKSAYETLHSLIDTAYSRIDPGEIIERIIDGLGDDHDIKILCALIVTKLVIIDKQQVARHLHEIAARFTPTVNYKLKDTAVKQEVERASEAQRDIMKASVSLNNAFGNGADVDQTIWVSWKAYTDMLQRDFKGPLADAEALVNA